MEIDLKLPSGLIFRDAPGMLKKKFEQWPWENYDGFLVSNPNRISEEDIDRVYQLGARTPRKVYQSLLEQHGDDIEACLGSLPKNCLLEDNDSSFSNLREPLVR